MRRAEGAEEQAPRADSIQRDFTAEIAEAAAGLIPADYERIALSDWAAATVKLSPLDRELERDNKVAVLRDLYRSPARVVDAALAQAGGNGNGKSQPATEAQQGQLLRLADPEPWHDPVNGAALLDEAVVALERFVALPDGAAVAIALWCLHAHCLDASAVTPRLALCSPEKRCGKTVALTVVMALVPRPLPASNITPAAVFRAVQKYHPTLCIDEADTFLHDKDELRGVLNSGHTRGTAFVVRTVGDDHDAVLFSTWAPVAVALIGRLPATLEDRAVVIPMRRRAAGEVVERLRLDRLAELEPIRRRMARWAADHFVELGIADPTIPDLGSDRAADNWRPLLAIADACGCEWPDLARQAARALQPGADADDAAGVMLLSDLRELFSDCGDDRLASEVVVRALAKMEERPWPEWRHGQPITQRQIARLLKPFAIHPTKYRAGTETVRGYLLKDFSDAFTRYLIRNSGTCLQNGTFQCGTETPPVPDEKPAICSEVPHVPDGFPY